MQETDNTLESANKLYAERRYQEAIPLYENCLPLLEQTYGREHPNVAVCLQGLGDCYWAVERFDKAAEAYGVLIVLGEKIVGSSHPDVISTIFKNAGCLDRLGRTYEAQEMYARAMALAEQTMPPGSPFLGKIMEGYAAMLKRTNLDPPLAVQLEERVYRNRELSMMPTGDMPALKDDETEEDIPHAQAQRGSSTNLRSRLQTAEEETEETTRKDWFKTHVKGKPHVWLSILAILIVLPLGAFLFNRMPRFGAAVEVQAQQELAGSSFQSADGLKKVNFVDGKTVEVLSGTKEEKLPYQVSTENQEKLTADQLSWLGDHIVDSDGTVLYRAGSKELSMSQAMLKVAAAADRCFKQTGEYPQDLNEWKERTFVSPYTNAEEIVTIDFLGTDGSWRPDAPTDRPAAEKKLLEEIPDPDQLKAKSAIICGYTVTRSTDNKMKALAFFVRGKDTEGKLLTGSHPGVIYAISLLNGRPNEIAGQYSSRSFSAPSGTITVFKR